MTIKEEEMLQELMKQGTAVSSVISNVLREVSDAKFFEVVEWQVASGGKRVRPALTMFFAAMAGKPTDGIHYAAAGIELIHNYSLVIDDIIDRGDLRRGRPTTRAKYGDEMALLAGMLHREAIWLCGMRAKPYEKEVSDIFSTAISALVEGERTDVLFEQEERKHDYFKKFKYTIVTEEDYLRMIAGKTGALIQAACKIGAIMAGSGPYLINAAEKFGDYIGLAFQITDDILDLFGNKEKFGKEIGKDIRESKLGNYAIIKALQNMEETTKDDFLKILRSRPSEAEKIQQCLSIIEKHRGLELAREHAMKYVELARQELSKFPESPQREILWALSEFMVVRSI